MTTLDAELDAEILTKDPSLETFSYDNHIVRGFAMATAGWGIVAFLVGLIVAAKLIFPGLLGRLPQLSYGRLRPLHTNAAIFAFGGNAIFVAVYYSLQRLCKARMYSDRLSAIHFWGWQLIIVTAALTLPLGFTTSKEYAELEWPIDLLITGVWVTFGWNMIGTVLRRRERHMYVSIWFYLATFITVALLHVVNSLELPVSFLKSYSMYAGRTGRTGPVVVRPQRRGLLPDHAVPGPDVLLRAEGRQPAGVLVPAVDRALLVADLPLHLGRAAPLALHRAAGLGAVAWHRVLDHAHRAVVGRHGQRVADAARRVGSGARGPGAEIHGRWDHRLRHGDVRRADAVAEERQRPDPLYGLHHRARARRRAGLERRAGVRDAVLRHAPDLSDEAVLRPAGQRALLAGDAGDPVLRDSDVRRRHHSKPDVAGVHG